MHDWKCTTGKWSTENAGLENAGPVSLRELNFKKRAFIIIIIIISNELHRVRKKRCHFIFACNSAKC